MKYLSLFSGYGGFELGIQQAYEEHNKNSDDTGKRQKTSEQQGVSILGNDGGFQRKEVFTNGKCENTAEAGVGKLYFKRAKLDETYWDCNVQEKRGGQEASQRVDEERKRLHTISSEATIYSKNRNNELPNPSTDEGQPHCIGFSEIDKYAIQTYLKHFPTHKNYGDITKLDPTTLPDFDLLVGGFPCQAFSIAGKRAGFEDTRGTLIYDVFRIIKEKHPKLVLLENVKGLLSHDNGRTFKTIITSLAELGYAVEWQVLNAKNFGVPQNRERVFIIGHLGGFGGRQVFPITQNNSEDIILPTITTRITADSNGTYVRKRPTHQTINKNYAEDKANTFEALRVLRTEIGEKAFYEWATRRLGSFQEEKVLQSEVYGEGVWDKTNQEQPTMDDSTLSRTEIEAERELRDLWNRECEGCPPQESRLAEQFIGELAKNLSELPQSDTPRIRRLTPIEAERLMGLPDGWTEGVSDTQRYKLCGNGVVVNVVEEIIKRLIYDL